MLARNDVQFVSVTYRVHCWQCVRLNDLTVRESLGLVL